MSLMMETAKIVCPQLSTCRRETTWRIVSDSLDGSGNNDHPVLFPSEINRALNSIGRELTELKHEYHMLSYIHGPNICFQAALEDRSELPAALIPLPLLPVQDLSVHIVCIRTKLEVLLFPIFPGFVCVELGFGHRSTC